MSQIGKFVQAGSGINTLTGNVGGAVGPTGGNINILGAGDVTVTGNPATSTLTISLSGAIPNSFQTDAGIAIPAANVLNILGGNNIMTTGAGNTVTIDLNGTTNHALQVGNATGSLTSLAVATDGQIPIGSTGVDPVIANITAGTNIGIVNGAGTITISAITGAQVVAYTQVTNAMSPYAVVATDYYLGADVTAGTVTVQLPNAPATGRIFAVKDVIGNAAVNNITVTTVGGVVNIDGATTFVMNTNYQAASFIFNGTSYEVY
jgi:hypothetical protein